MKPLYDDAFPFYFGLHDKDRIVLSNFNLTAESMYSEETSFSCITGSVTYGGTWQKTAALRWKVLLEELSDSPRSVVHVGVSWDANALLSREACVYGSGKRRRSPSSKWVKVAGMPAPWEQGDVLVLTLDRDECGTRRLHLEMPQYGYSTSMDLLLGQYANWPLQPFFYVNCGQKITLLPCEQI